MESNVMILKLITGEEIIGSVKFESEGKIAVEKPLAVMMTMTEDGVKFGFAPWSPLCEGDKRVLTEDHVLFAAKPRDNVLQNYNSMTGGIVVPSKSLITG